MVVEIAFNTYWYIIHYIILLMKPSIIQWQHSTKELTDSKLNKLADLVLFYWEYRFDNPHIELAKA